MKRTLTAVLAACLAALAPAGARAGTPAAGVAQQIRSGFFADVNLGGFFTGGGYNSSGSKGVSNAQAYLQLGVGYDVIKATELADKFGLSIGIHFGVGPSSASCFSEVDKSGNCVYTGTNSTAPDNFTVMMFGAEVVFKARVYERLYLRPRVEGGYALFDSQPIQGTGGGGYLGVGFGIEYATHMDHFSIGADVGVRLILGPNMPVVSFYPMIKYTY
jgi:hypothetical protein